MRNDLVLVKGNKHYDSKQFEKEIFIDRINQISFIVKEFQKLYERAPITEHLFRAKVLKEIEHTKKILSKVQTEYEMFKKYRTSRTT